jgi:hypothetical protein
LPRPFREAIYMEPQDGDAQKDDCGGYPGLDIIWFLLQVFTWGHKMVMPRRVNVARDTRKAGPAPLKFHRAERLHVVAIAAGGVHSTLISQEGLVFYWESPDVQLRCRQVRLVQGV